MTKDDQQVELVRELKSLEQRIFSENSTIELCKHRIERLEFQRKIFQQALDNLNK